MKKNPASSEYMLYSDAQFVAMLYRSIEKYLKFKRSCTIAEKLLNENCHDFYISIDSEAEDYSYKCMINAANQRNIPIDYSIYNLDCSVEEIASVLSTMCGLELSWLDEHRTIFDTCDDKVASYYDEEEKIISFYRTLISSLSLEDISRVEEDLEDTYMLAFKKI